MKTIRFQILIIWLLLLFGCSQKGIENLVKTNFDSEVPLRGNLEFTFDEDKVDENKLNKWTANQYITFSPNISGRFKWKSPRELIFSPYSRLKPATEYVAIFSETIFKDLPVPERTLVFNTPFLQLDDASAFWTITKTGDMQLQLDLNFNYRVNPEDVAQLLTIQINDKPLEFILVKKYESKKISFYIPDMIVEDRDFIANIKIQKGLKAVDFVTQTNSEFTKTAKIPSPYEFKIKEVKATHDGFKGSISVQVSQEVAEQNIRNFIQIDPKINFTVKTNKDYIIIESTDFNVDKKYELIIAKNLQGKLKGKLKYEYNQLLGFGKIKPTISFVNNKSVYLSGTGNRNLELNIINIDEIEVHIYKLYQNNIIPYFRNDYYYAHSNYNIGFDDYVDRPGNLGDEVWNADIKTRELPKKGKVHFLKLDFEEKIGKRDGIYIVEVKSKESNWLRERKIVAISDIGLIAKAGKNTITVFANSIRSAKSLAGVQLQFYGRNNQKLAEAVTNANGVAVIKTPEAITPNFKTALITANYRNDFNFLPLSRTLITTSRFDVGGKRSNLAGYDAFIYGDRDIYRPGETIHIATIIRDENWKAPAELPVYMKITTPRGKVFKTIRKTLDANGAFETSIQLPASAFTGSYTTEVFTSNNIFLGSKIITVEEFMPDRIKVNTNINKTEVNVGESLEIQLEAINLFGPPAADRSFEIEMSLKNKYFRPKQYSDYNFSIHGRRSRFNKIVRTGKTDKQGVAKETFEIPAMYKNMGYMGANFFITVFDETGRPVSRQQNVDIYTQDIFFGIKIPDYYNKTGERMKIPMIAVDKNGKAQSGIKTDIQLIKHEYRTVLSRNYGSYFRYRSEHEEIVLEEKTVTINASGSEYLFIPKESGKFEIRVMPHKGNNYVSQHFYAYGMGRTTYSSFEVNNEGTIDIVLDKEQYQNNETAKVLLKTPFSGKILVTIENDNVLDNFYLETDKRAASFDLPLNDRFVPNVYISATLFREHQSSDIPLTVAHGFAPVMLENKNNELPVTITANEKSRSRTKQKIRVKTSPNTAVTIAAVDEGILQLTGYQTPNPYQFFYRKRALEVQSYNIYPFLLPEIDLQSGKPGGGAGPDLQKRLNPLPNKRVKLVSFWSGIQKTNNRGIVDFDIDIPQYSGDLRIMAVAFKNNAFGSNHTNMKVADPIVLSVPLPRFLSPMDTVEIPVMMSNTTSKNATCNTNIEVEGPITVLEQSKQNISLDANSENRVNYRIVAKQDVGQAKVTVKALGFGEKFMNTTDITVRPASPLLKNFGSGVVKAAETANINFNVQNFIPQSIGKELIVSKSPLVEFSYDLRYLVHYPYGCLEQTVSSVFPQLYYQDLVKTMMQNQIDTRTPNYNVQEAIKKLMLMQLYNGGLTFWPGSGSESWWGSVYAAHFLIEAEKAGYHVDKDMKNKLLQYLKTKLKKKRTFVYFINQTTKREFAPKEAAYSLYVLALANDPDISTMNYFKSNRDLLSMEGKYLLASAYALSGDKDKFKKVLPAEFVAQQAIQPPVIGSFSSRIRDEAIALNALLEINPNHPQVPVLAKHVSQQLKNKRYLNTQERSFGFLAMGKIARQAAKYQISAEIQSSQKNIVAQFQNKTLTLGTKELHENIYHIMPQSKNQQAKLYYFYQSEGISYDGSYNKEDSYMRVRRTFYNRFGRKITSNTFTQNDLIVVQISITGTSNARINNVVISDLLPAGFEIENPRIKKVPGMAWIKNKSFPDYIDMRDDRINLFVNVSNKTRYYYYLVRAVSCGTFHLPPIAADAMYNGEYHSYHGDGIVKIKQ